MEMIYKSSIYKQGISNEDLMESINQLNVWEDISDIFVRNNSIPAQIKMTVRKNDFLKVLNVLTDCGTSTALPIMNVWPIDPNKCLFTFDANKLNLLNFVDFFTTNRNSNSILEGQIWLRFFVENNKGYVYLTRMYNDGITYYGLVSRDSNFIGIV